MRTFIASAEIPDRDFQRVSLVEFAAPVYRREPVVILQGWQQLLKWPYYGAHDATRGNPGTHNASFWSSQKAGGRAEALAFNSIKVVE